MSLVVSGVKMTGIAIALLLLGSSPAGADSLPRDRQLRATVDALGRVPIDNCTGPACKKTRAAHRSQIQGWLKEMRRAVKKGHGGCASLRSKQRGKWKITGFWCEGDVYPEYPDDPMSTGEPERVVLRWKCLDQQCYLTNLRANGDESRKAGFRVRFKQRKAVALRYFPYKAVQNAWMTE